MQFQTELELKVKVLDKELDELEKRIQKFQNPFTASGSRRNDKRLAAAKRAQQAELKLVQQAINAEDRLRETKAQKRLQTNVRRVNYLHNQRMKKERELAAARQKRAEGIKLGIGFPLLFGGGLGSVAGGLLGALTDDNGGFGGQILFSAIGQKLDEAVQRAAALGKAIQDIDASALDESLGGVSTELARQVELLKKIGEEDRARALLADEVTRRTGLAGDAAQQINASVEILQKGWNDVVNTVSSLVGLLTAPLAGALGRILELVAMVAKGWNLILTAIMKAHMAQVNFFSGEEGVKKLKAQYEQMYESIEEGEIQLKAARDKYYKDLAVSKRFRGQEVALLQQELAIKKMTSQEDRYKKATAEANLKVEKARLEIEKARSKFFRAKFDNDFSGMTSARQEWVSARDNQARALAEKEVAAAAERTYEQYTRQADALQQVVTQSKLRLNAEQAVAAGRSKLTGAYYSAELKLNELAIQRAKQKGDTNKVLQLELRQVTLIYQQTVSQIQAEVERTRLKERQVALDTKILQVAQLRKQAEGKALNNADLDAMKVQEQALDIARYNVQVSEQVAEQQIRGATAVYQASKEALVYANNQNQVANAAERTANAQVRGANAAARAAKSMRSVGGSRPGLGTSNLAINALVNATRRTNGVGYGMRQQDYSRALNQQTEILRRIEGKQAYNTYQGQARELQSLGYRAPANPYRNYRSIRGSRFAEGGFVTKPTQATIGERGESEYVIPESKMSSAMGRYARGDRGDSVVKGATNAEGKSNKGKAVVNVNTGPVMRMNNKDYVTVNDMNSALGSVVAAMSTSSGNYKSSARVG